MIWRLHDGGEGANGAQLILISPGIADAPATTAPRAAAAYPATLLLLASAITSHKTL